MSVEAINAIEFLAPAQPIKFDGDTASAGGAAGGGFAAWLDKELGNVNNQIVNADNQVRKLAAGEVDNLHQVMISMEEAKMTFQLALQVRNRLLEAYQDVLRMQI
jgi:flagellar hook-basal body complex protein FliE